MSKMIQIRNVPETLHRGLKARAANEGMSLSDFIKRELQKSMERPTMREWLELTKRITPLRTTRSAEAVVREMRDSR